MEGKRERRAIKKRREQVRERERELDGRERGTKKKREKKEEAEKMEKGKEQREETSVSHRAAGRTRAGEVTQIWVLILAVTYRLSDHVQDPQPAVL